MNTVFKKEKKFHPQFLYKDTDWINKKINVLRTSAETCNNAIEEVQKLFKRKLSDEEKQQIPTGKWKYVSELLKQESNFPNAEIETLISLLGIDPKPAQDAIKKIPGYTHDLSFEKSEFILTKETIQKTEEIGTYYTKNDAQNKALNCYQSICDALNEGIDNGVIFQNESWDEKFRYKLSATKTKKNNWGFKPNYDYIRQTYRSKEQ